MADTDRYRKKKVSKDQTDVGPKNNLKGEPRKTNPTKKCQDESFQNLNAQKQEEL